MRGARIVEDLRHLPWVQLVVDRYRHALGGPNAEQQLDNLRSVLAGDRDPRAHRMVVADRAGQSQGALAQLAPGAAASLAVIHRAAVRKALRGMIQQREQVHRSVHSEFSAYFDRYFVVLHPPSTTMVCPLMKLPPGEHRNATVLATSSTVPSRSCGVISTCIRRKRGSWSRSSVIAVWITPGATALHRMPCAPYWAAM